MLPTTLDAIKAMLRADPSISPGDRARLLAQLRKGPGEADPAPTAAPEQRIIRRAEVARRMSVSLRAVDNWHRAGILRKVTLPGRVRAAGFRASDVDALIAGKEACHE